MVFWRRSSSSCFFLRLFSSMIFSMEARMAGSTFCVRSCSRSSPIWSPLALGAAAAAGEEVVAVVWSPFSISAT
jgi:hypothetical protein